MPLHAESGGRWYWSPCRSIIVLLALVRVASIIGLRLPDINPATTWPAKRTMARSQAKQVGAMLALLLAAAGPASAATFEDGLVAYNRRDYALAVRLWQGVAE